jgi:predicted small secreted protein
MKKILVLLLVLTTLIISGCETFHGLGKDFENAGTWLQQKSS